MGAAPLGYKFLDAEADAAKFDDGAASYLDLVLGVLRAYVSVLNLDRSGHAARVLIGETNNDPGLLCVTIV